MLRATHPYGLPLRRSPGPGIPGRHLVAHQSNSAQQIRGKSILVERLYIG